MVNLIMQKEMKMSKLEDNLNDILGIENNNVDVEEFKAPTVRK